MCGFVGVIDLLRRRRLPDTQDFARMLDSIAHRGPDGAGIHRDSDVVLGHRRLAVIDLGTSSAQPFVKADVALVFNGEIYNFRALRRQLEARGHVFASDGDTEVVLEAWRAWGPRCVDHLDGMFAFVVVDGDTVFAARDHVGIKPLFWRVDDGVLWFASELKAIVADARVPRVVDDEALDCLLTHGFVPAPLTPFSGIAALAPATTLTLTRDDLRPRLHRWWRPRASSRRIGIDDAVAELDARLVESVGAQLVSDVPVGAFLSGGIDSASVVRAMRDQRDDVRSFSLGFRAAGLDDFDETADAARTAALVGARHVNDLVDLDLQRALRSIAATNDDLLADASFIATDLLSARTRRDVTVALSGDGADEIFAGYPTYPAARFTKAWRRVPRPLRALTTTATTLLPATTTRYPLRELGLRFLRGAERGPARDFAGFRQLFDDDTRRRLLRRHVDGHAIDRYADAVFDADADDPLKQLLIADLVWLLPNDMLVKVDRASMRHGLEVRVPFLSRSMIDFALSLPSSLLLSSTGTSKRVLREHVGRRISPELARGRKRGFSVPVAAAFKGALGDLLEHELDDAFAADGPLHVDVVRALLREHRAGRADHGHALFAVVTLVLWWRRFIAA